MTPGRRPEASWDGPPLAPTRDLVALLVRGAGSAEPCHGWTIPDDGRRVVTDTLRPLQDSPPRSGGHEETPISGRAVLRDVVVDGERRGSSALQWLDFSDATTTSVSFPVRAAGSPSREFAGHAASCRVAVGEHWMDPSVTSAEKWARARFSVHVATLDGAGPRLLATFDGGVYADEDSSSMQWSPDGTAIALCRRWVDLQAPEKGWHRAVVVLSAQDGTLLASWPDACLAGSASWSPDSGRLLIQPEGRTTAVQDVHTDQRVPVLPPPRRPSDFRGRRALALVDDDRVVVMDDTRGPAVISIDSLDGTRSSELLRWRTPHPTFPRVSALAPEAWDRALLRGR